MVNPKMDINRMMLAQQQKDALVIKIASDIFAGVMAEEIINICEKIKSSKDKSKLEIKMEIGLPIRMSMDAAKTFVKAIT